MFIRNAPEFIDSNNIKTYACGSPNLKDFLILNGIYPIYQYIHVDSKRTIWLFVECDDLSKLLIEWSNNKPSKEGGE